MSRTIPGRVLGSSGNGCLTGVIAISATSFSGHSLALKHDGTVWAWETTARVSLEMEMRL